MKLKESGQNGFPHYLKPGPNKAALEWLGRQLRQRRGSKTPTNVAQLAGVSPKQIQAMEKGSFHLNLGRLRGVIRRGYEGCFEDLLAECYATFRSHFDPTNKRPFEREYHYSLLRRSEQDKKPTPLLIGGDPSSYLWAVPMRRLKGQSMVTEFLELAPSRKRKSSGLTADNSHDGVEVIYVVHGTVEAHIAFGAEGFNTRRLKAGDCIHFHARHFHHLENLEKSTSALLFVVRLPEVPL